MHIHLSVGSDGAEDERVLRDLFLADNKLMPSDGVHLGSLLRFNHKLKLLDVRNNQLGVSPCFVFLQ